MPIEFSCVQCKSLLRVPDDTAGKKSQSAHGVARFWIFPNQRHLRLRMRSRTRRPIRKAQPALALSIRTSPPVMGQDYETSPTRGDLKGRVIGPAVGMMVASGLSLLLLAL